MLQPWTGHAAHVGLPAAALVVLISFCVALGWGSGQLDRPFSWPVLLGGVGGILVGAAVATRTWGHSRRWARRGVAGVVGLLVCAFGIGVITNPVVVEGQVFLSTSPQARSYVLMQQVHTDLLRLRALDVYLTYSAADAGAHYNEYQPALDELTALSNRYAGYTSSSLPDPRFSETVEAVKSSAYWASKAMQAKIALLDQEDAKYADNVATFRTNFAQQYVAAGRALSFLSADLNIPLDQREHE